MKIKTLLVGLVAIVAVSSTVLTAKTADAATKTLKVTDDIKLLYNGNDNAGFKNNCEPSVEVLKDGTVHVTMYWGTVVALKTNAAKGYYVASSNTKSSSDVLAVSTKDFKYLESHVDSKISKKVTSSYTCLYSNTHASDGVTTKNYTLKLRQCKVIKMNAKGKSLSTCLFSGNTVKIKVTVKKLVPEGFFDTKEQKAFVNALNDYRVNTLGIDAVKVTENAQAYAELRAKELQSFGYTHERPNGQNKPYSECIYTGGSTNAGKDYWDIFKASEQHYRLLVQSGTVEFGIAVYTYGGKTYIVAINLAGFDSPDEGTEDWDSMNFE